jgi:hypothetical protein
MSAVVPQDLADYLGVTFTSAQENRARVVLDGLQSELEAFLGRPVEIRNFQEDHPWGDQWDDKLEFRNTPVVRVNSVKAVGTFTDVESVEVVAPAYYTVMGWGLAGLYTLPCSWPILLRVDYDAGLDLTTPKYRGMTLAILKAADRWFQAKGADDADDLSQGGTITSLSTDGGYQVAFADRTAGIGSFHSGELAPFSRYKRR